MAGGPPNGGPVGRAFGSVLADVLTKHKAATIGPELAAEADARKAHWERGESELGPVVAKLFADVLDDEHIPENIKELIRTAAGPEHQWQVLLVAGALISVMLTIGQHVFAGEFQRIDNRSFTTKGDRRLTPSEAATAVVKGEMDFLDAGWNAAAYGMHNDVFSVLTNITGNPPGPQELGLMFRRGLIDEGQYHYGIAHSLIQTQWASQLLALSHGPAPSGAAIEAYVKGFVSYDDVRTTLSHNGTNPDNAAWLVQSAGRPPGTMEMLQLLNRGAVDQPTVEAAIRESDVKNKYIPAILQMRRHMMPQRTIVSAIHQGVFNADQALLRLHQIGFNDEDAQALVQEGMNSRKEKTKDLAVTQITALYEDEAIARTDASSMLVALGYDDHEAGMILDLADFRVTRRFEDAALARIHALYVARQIEDAAASTDMDTLHVPASQRNRLLALWKLERDSTVLQLTVAQVQKGVKMGLIDANAAKADFVHRGYSDRDATILVAEAG